jgi:hypothetical protein
MGVQFASAGLLAVACAVASGAPVSVGRASTETPADQNWVVQPLAPTTMNVTGGVDGQIQMANTALWLPSGRGKAEAVLVLRGTQGGHAGSLHWHSSCESLKASPSLFVRNQWRNLVREWREDCVAVAGPTRLSQALRKTHPAVADLLRDKGVELPGSGYVIRATVAQGGTYLSGVLYVVQSFKGSIGRIQVDLGPAQIPPAVAQWGADLSVALESSTRSMSGKFELPRIESARGDVPRADPPQAEATKPAPRPSAPPQPIGASN